MNILKIIFDALVEHPVAFGFLALVGIRIIFRDIQTTKIFIEAHTKKVSDDWDGVDRRGPNRAKNVFRPAFGATQPQEQFNELELLRLNEIIAKLDVDAKSKTGTDD